MSSEHNASRIKEQQQRSDVIPPGWIWMASGATQGAMDYYAERLVETRQLHIGVTHHNELWTMVTPTDHDGKENFYSVTRGNEIVVMFPKDSFMNDPGVYPIGDVNIKKGEYYLVGVQEVTIDGAVPPGHHGYPDTRRHDVFTRYSVVNVRDIDAYYKALGNTDRALITTPRKVTVVKQVPVLTPERNSKLQLYFSPMSNYNPNKLNEKAITEDYFISRPAIFITPDDDKFPSDNAFSEEIRALARSLVSSVPEADLPDKVF